LKRRILYRLAQAAGAAAALRKKYLSAPDPPIEPPLPEGISVVIPSRNGRELLAALLPGLERELEGIRSEIIVVDNGSEDGTGEFLAGRVDVECSPAALSFARAVNRGIRRARFAHVLLLNNDMVLEPAFFAPLLKAFRAVPDLFCATAQILFPEGKRRQETGKAVMPPDLALEDFPVRCELPIAGEDLSYVLYGSGGCSLYETRKLRQLGGMSEVFEPAYVEDLDLGYRGWSRGWPTVFVSEARLIHFHRSTTSRYYSERDLKRAVELNYLRFLARSVASPRTFLKLWSRALRRLDRIAATHPDSPALDALAQATNALGWVEAGPAGPLDDELIFAIGSGDVAVFPGKSQQGLPSVLITGPHLPSPASEQYKQMRRDAANFDQTLLTLSPELKIPAAELLEICSEIVLVRKRSAHDSAAYRAALHLTARKHNPVITRALSTASQQS
jgi:GT2 family glycosyltransferase